VVPNKTRGPFAPLGAFHRAFPAAIVRLRRRLLRDAHRAKVGLHFRPSPSGSAGDCCEN
jgi:hypothetical protein